MHRGTTDPNQLQALAWEFFDPGSKNPPTCYPRKPRVRDQHHGPLSALPRVSEPYEYSCEGDEALRGTTVTNADC